MTETELHQQLEEEFYKTGRTYPYTILVLHPDDARTLIESVTGLSSSRLNVSSEITLQFSYHTMKMFRSMDQKKGVASFG